LQKIAAPFFAL